jgi:TldD protein
MDRRRFLGRVAAGVTATGALPNLLRAHDHSILSELDRAQENAVALAAIDAARAAGASYADARVARVRRESIATRERRVTSVDSSDTYGLGVRVLVNGAWGFVASRDVSVDEAAAVARRAVAQARANRARLQRPVELSPVQAFRDVEWHTPIVRDPWDVPLEEKVDLMLRANAAALTVRGARFANSAMNFHTETVTLATTDGSLIVQTIHRTIPSLTVTAVAEDGSDFQARNSSEVPALQAGYEYIEEIDYVALSPRLAEEAVQKLSARRVEPGRYDIILHPSNLFLTIHESIAHPTELDRALGYEANYAGTSFIAPPEQVIGKLRLGKELMNIRAERTRPRALATTGWDHEAVPAQEWDIVKDGIFVNYQTTREQAAWIADLTGVEHSLGCSYAESWADTPFQRMPNVNLVPATEDITTDDIIADTRDGIYILGRGSYSIDQQRYNFQFGGQVFHEVKNGKITGMLKDVAYQARTPEFWNSMDAIGGPSTWHMGGTAGDAKGQPSQSNAVTHGCPVARFRQVNIINTARG